MTISTASPIAGKGGTVAEALRRPSFVVDDPPNLGLIHAVTTCQLILRNRPGERANLGNLLPIKFRRALEAGIVSVCRRLHMLGIDTRRIRTARATVIRHHPLGEWSIPLFKEPTMRPQFFTVDPKPTVSVFVERELPNPATSNRIDNVLRLGIGRGSHVVTKQEAQRFAFDVTMSRPVLFSNLGHAAASAMAITVEGWGRIIAHLRVPSVVPRPGLLTQRRAFYCLPNYTARGAYVHPK